MRFPITTQAALLQALREGAGYGLDLIRRVERISAGGIRLSEARAYPALSDLEKQGLVEVLRVTPGGHRGARSRTYYDLTLRGVQASTREHATLSALVAVRPKKVSPRETRLMAQRIERAAELSAFAHDIRGAMLGEP